MNGQEFPEGGWIKQSVPSDLTFAIAVICGVVIGSTSHTRAQEGMDALKAKAIDTCKALISVVATPIMSEALAPMADEAPEILDAVTTLNFEQLNDLSGGSYIYLEWERLEIEIKPHPTYGMSLFFPAYCLGDLETRKITKVGFFRGNQSESLDPGAIGRVFDDRAAELVASDQGTSF